MLRVMLVVVLGTTLVAFAVLRPEPAVPPAAPLAQATATPTMPAFIDYGNGWGVQPLPRANANCFTRGERPQDAVPARGMACVSGTPVTP